MVPASPAETKLSEDMPRFVSYHLIESGIDLTVRTTWSSDLTVAAGFDIFSMSLKGKGLTVARARCGMQDTDLPVPPQVEPKWSR